MSDGTNMLSETKWFRAVARTTREVQVLPESVWFRLACVLSAMTALFLFGVFGIGHGGPSSTNVDAGVLYVAGLHWWSGLSAYGYSLQGEIVPDLVATANLYDSGFAYPPQIAPLCLLLAAFPLDQAKLLMTSMNVAAALALGVLGAGLGYQRGGEGGRTIANDPRWLMAALVIGSPSTAYAVWAGQTALLVAVALLAGWYYARRNSPIIGGILLGIASIKPQVMIAAMLWLMLERRWRTVATSALTVLLLGIVPLVISGPVDLLADWYSAVTLYASNSYNLLGSRMVFGIPSFLQAMDIPMPPLLGPLVIIGLVGAFWCFRSRILAADILTLLLGVSLLFGYSHGYDLVMLAPMVAAFWRHLTGRPIRSLTALGLFLVITFPNSIVEPFGNPFLLHARVIALAAAVVWLCVMSVKHAVGIQTSINRIADHVTGLATCPAPSRSL